MVPRLPPVLARREVGVDLMESREVESTTLPLDPSDLRYVAPRGRGRAHVEVVAMRGPS